MSGPQTGARVSAGDIASLTNMATKNLQSAAQAVDGYGRAKRSQAIAQLLGSSDFQKMDSNEALGAIQKLTGGGSVNKDISGSVSQLLKSKADAETKAISDKSAMERLMKQSETQLEVADMQSSTQKQEGMLNRDTEQKIASIRAQVELAKQKNKESTLSKAGAKKIAEDAAGGKQIITEQANKLEEYISDKTDFLFDSEMDDTSRRIMFTKLKEFLSTPKGQEAYLAGGPELSYNMFTAYLDRKGLTIEDEFDWFNILPFGDTPYQKKIVEK